MIVLVALCGTQRSSMGTTAAFRLAFTALPWWGRTRQVHRNSAKVGKRNLGNVGHVLLTRPTHLPSKLTPVNSNATIVKIQYSLIAGEM